MLRCAVVDLDYARSWLEVEPRTEGHVLQRPTSSRPVSSVRCNTTAPPPSTCSQGKINHQSFGKEPKRVLMVRTLSMEEDSAWPSGSPRLFRTGRSSFSWMQRVLSPCQIVSNGAVPVAKCFVRKRSDGLIRSRASYLVRTVVFEPTADVLRWHGIHRVQLR